MLGVTVQGINADLAKSLGLERTAGAIVSDVQAGSPAATAGIKEGDVILALNGTAIDSSNSLRNQVAPLGPGAHVTLSILRDGEKRDLKAVLTELPSDERASNGGREGNDPSGYGLSVQPITPEIAGELQLDKGTKGVVVAGVRPDSRAAEAGLEEGDVIQQVNGKTIETPNQLRGALDSASKDRPALLLVRRDGRRLFLTMDKG
jgi:S1-C subfamily serine protease